MSALGQKQTSWREILMSALPPKADIPSGEQRVRFVPKADLPTSTFCVTPSGRAQKQLGGSASHQAEVRVPNKCQRSGAKGPPPARNE